MSRCGPECADGGADTIPIACTPEAIPVERRAEHHARLVSVMAKMRGAETLPDGFLLAWRAEDFLDVAKWIDLERLCCPFADFELRAGRDGVTLRLTGPEGAADYLLSLMSPGR